MKTPKTTLEDVLVAGQKAGLDAEAMHILEDTLRWYSSDPSRRAVNQSGGCEYLTKDGKKCAGGRYVLPDKYTPEMEGVSWATVVMRWPYAVSPEAIRHLALVILLQRWHDNITGIEWDAEGQPTPEGYDYLIQNISSRNFK